MIAVTRSAPVSANVPIWVAWYASASSAVIGSADDVAVATRTDAAGDDDGRLGSLELVTQGLEQGDGPAVQLDELGRRVPEPLRPVGTGAPGRRLEHDPDASLARDADVRLEVASERVLAALAREQVVRGEVREIEAVVEDEGGLEPAVGQERDVLELRQCVAVPRCACGLSAHLDATPPGDPRRRSTATRGRYETSRTPGVRLPVHPGCGVLVLGRLVVRGGWAHRPAP